MFFDLLEIEIFVQPSNQSRWWPCRYNNDNFYYIFYENLFQSFGWGPSQSHEDAHFLTPNIYGMFAVFTSVLHILEMGGACSAYGGEERRIQGFGGET